MKITTRKNSNDHLIADCPFCDYFAYVRPITKASPDPLRDLKRHITNAAKNEALAEAVRKPSEPVEVKHLDYYIAHTTKQKIVQTTKRVYDNDMTI